MIGSKQKGAVLLTASAFFFALMSAFVRLAGDLPFWQKVIFRNAGALLMATAALLRSRTSPAVPRKNLLTLSGRILFGMLAVLSNYYAIDRLPLASSNSLAKLAPFFAMVFAAVFLKERLSRFQGLCVAIALAGCMLLVIPGLRSAGLALVIGTLGGVFSGGAHVFLRILQRNKDLEGSVIVFWFAAVLVAVTLGPCAVQWQPVTFRQTLCLLGVGVSGGAAQFLLTAAYRCASPRDISVYDCSQIIFGGLFGLILFGQIPPVIDMVAYGLIILASAVLFFYYRWEAAAANKTEEKHTT